MKLDPGTILHAVYRHGGQYEDRYYDLIAVYADREKALEHVKLAMAKHVELRTAYEDDLFSNGATFVDHGCTARWAETNPYDPYWSTYPSDCKYTVEPVFIGTSASNYAAEREVALDFAKSQEWTK